MRGVNVHAAGTRLAASAAVGAAVAISLVAVLDPWLAGIAGWIVVSAAFSLWTWAIVGRLGPDETRRHATREDPTHAVSRAVLVLASLASLIGVGVLLMAGSVGGGTLPWAAITGVASVVASWVLVHVLYMLHYARLFYNADAGLAIDFGGDTDPDYHDFAYLAFTIGMTYQVSDTAVSGAELRRVVLRHAMLSYLLGAVVLAVTLNLVVQLSSAFG